MIGLEPLSPFLAWVQNPNYTEKNVGREFLDNYAYAELLGKDGLFHSDSLAFGILMLGPNCLYPEHHHRATEDYYVVAGQATWRLDGSKTLAARAGTHVAIRSGVVHEMSTAAEALIAIYIWDGDVLGRAELMERDVTNR